MKFKEILAKLKVTYQKIKYWNYIPPIVGFSQNEKFIEQLKLLIVKFSQLTPELSNPFEGPVGSQFCRLRLNFVGSEENLSVFKLSVKKLMLTSLYCWGYSIYTIYVDTIRSDENEVFIDFYYSYDSYTDENLKAWYQRLARVEKSNILKGDLRDNALERELNSNGL